MQINYEQAQTLEIIVRNAHLGCGRYGMGGYINVDHFLNYPFDAALIALAPYWTQIDAKALDNFLSSWDTAIRENETTEFDVDKYISDLESILYPFLYKNELD